MFRTFGAAALLTFACVIPLQQAAAQDPIAGGIFGGAAGAIIGGALGGRGGAVAGAIIGGTTGAAIAAEGQRRRGGYYYYQNGCYMQRPDGAYVAVAPQYCGGPVVDDDDEVEYVAPPPRAVGADAVAACARRYRSYDPASGTFLSNDGMRKPCP
jgi:hypothetical protein